MQANTRLVMGTVRSTGLAGFGMLLIAVVDPVTRLALPAALAGAVDSTIDGRPATPALIVLGAVLGVATLCEAAREYLETRTKALGALFLRRRLLRHVFALGVDGRRKLGAGDVLNRMLESAEVTASGTSVLVALATSLVTSVGGLIALLLIEPSLAVLFLVAAPLLWWLTRWLIRRVGAMTNEYQRVLGELSSRFVDAVRGARTIRSCGTVEQEIDRVLVPLPDLSVLGRDYWEAQRKATWQAGLCIPVLQVSVLAVAGIGVVRGQVTPGELIAAQAYLMQAMGLLGQTAILARFAQARGGAGRVQDLLSIPPARSGTRRLPDGGGQLSLRGITVSRDQRSILDRLDLDVPAGRAIAVVGADGAANAALAEVAGGLVAPDEGTVLLDGVALAELVPADVRKAVSYAFERPKLLGERLDDALAYCDDPPGPERVAEALRSCAALDFVERLPMKHRTPLAELRLSGGELQRLGLARAAVRDARVVVLSDPMSSVDTATEAEITTALNRTWQHTTRIIVAHRMSIAARADLVAWLDHGTVRACGTHHELLKFSDYRAVFQARKDGHARLADESIRDTATTPVLRRAE